MNRRAFIVMAAAALVPEVAGATPSSVTQKRLENRLELWNNYASRTENLLARLVTTRHSSLLEDRLVVTGSLLFVGPSTLVLRDDDLSGSTTWIDGSTVRLLSNRGRGVRPAKLPTTDEPAAQWLAARLVGLFAPGDESTMIGDSRTNVPRGRGYRLDLMPPRGSPIRKKIRSLTVHLDPVAGAVTQILIAEAQGDRVRLQLTDHRQNIPEADADAQLDQVRALDRPQTDTDRETGHRPGGGKNG